MLVILSVFIPPAAVAQEVSGGGKNISNGTINVYLDFDRRYRDYEDYLKTEIPVVNYVRDRKLADVHILMTTQETGSRGQEFTIALMGQQMCADINDTLCYVSKQMDTEETTRSGVSQNIKIGLVPFISRTAQAENIRISFTPSADVKKEKQEVDDKWDYWVFNINTNNRFDGEASRQTLFFRGSASADRITPDWKISFSVNGDYNRRTYKTDDDTTDTIESITKTRRFSSLIVKSRGDHWSTGAFGSAESSTYNNLKTSYDLAPAIEYDVFPYSESTRREFRILYRAGYNNRNYYEETIYSKTHEALWYENLTTTIEIKERWGSVSSTIEGSHYFHDFSKNKLSIFGNLNLRVIEGLSLDLSGNVSLIHDQLALPVGDVTEEEVLLNRQQLSTQYNYSLSVGLRYTFGSIFSNVVNPRFFLNPFRGTQGGMH